MSQFRNQLSVQQDERLQREREALNQRQEELRSVDQRIRELQLRLQKKRASNITLYQKQHHNNSTLGDNKINEDNNNGNKNNKGDDYTYINNIISNIDIDGTNCSSNSTNDNFIDGITAGDNQEDRNYSIHKSTSSTNR